GRVGGVALKARSAVGFMSAGPGWQELNVVISDGADDCRSLALFRPGSTSLTLTARVVDSAVHPLQGRFALLAVTPNNPAVSQNAQAVLQQFNADSQSTWLALAEGGELELDDQDWQHASGAFRLDFGNGDQLTGQFSAPLCGVDRRRAIDQPDEVDDYQIH